MATFLVELYPLLTRGLLYCVLFITLMSYWYELTGVQFVTIEYGRYEAVRNISEPSGYGYFTWTPVLAGPRP